MEFNLADLFEGVADVVPDRAALVVGPARWTYAELDARANRLAHVLAGLGVGSGDHVGLGLYNGIEYVEGMLACYKLRAVPINLNYRYLEDELRYLLQDSGCRLVVHDPDLTDRLAAVREDAPALEVLLPIGADYDAHLTAASPVRDFGPRSADDLYILYTGGTTGMPKGVLWRHEDIFFAAMGGKRPPGRELQTPGDVVAAVDPDGAAPSVLAGSPLMHGSAQWAAFQMFNLGGTLVLSDRPSLDPEALWQQVADERIGLLFIVGDAFAMPLLDALRSQPGRWDLSSLRVVMSGGAVISPTAKAGFAELVPEAKVIDTYGSSEGGAQGQVAPVADPQGRPRFEVGPDTAVLDDDGRPLPPGSGVVGRLARRGAIPLGYHGDEAKTRATFPTYHGVRWSVPGDMALLEADGTVVLLGRGSVCINTGGEKVYPEEVEAVLKGAPGVFDAVVVGVPDPRWGEAVVAVVELRAGVAIDDDAVLAHARGLLSSYKLPRRFVTTDAIVRSPSGKADYRWAREHAVQALA